MCAHSLRQLLWRFVDLVSDSPFTNRQFGRLVGDVVSICVILKAKIELEFFDAMGALRQVLLSENVRAQTYNAHAES